VQIGVFSDTHDNLNNLKIVLDAYRAAGLARLIHCGDMTSAATARHLDGFELIYVDGNMDQAPEKIYRALREVNPHNVVVPTYEGEIDGVRIAVTHGDHERELQRLIGDGSFRYIFHGHTHRRRDEMDGSTRIFNPGALGGLKFESWSYCIFDLDSDQATVIELPES
jgi:putative phosphoesterase